MDGPLEKHLYIYEGPVMVFGNLIMNDWKAETMAVSKAKARNNFKYRFKQIYGHIAVPKIELPGKLYLAEGSY